MRCNGFTIASSPFITDAFCKNCGKYLKQVSNGLLGVAMFCPNCENVYEIKLIKVSKEAIPEKFLEQARKEVKQSSRQGD